MVVKATQVIGLPIFTIKDGKKLETTVRDVVYDPVANKVEALVIDEGGWFSDARVLLIQDLKSIGEDAVVIESEDMVKDASEVKQKVTNIAKSENYLTTDKVVTEAGKDLGRITDMYFDSKTGKVDRFEVSQGALKDVSSGKRTFKTTDIKTIGEDAMIVGSYVDEKFDKQAQQTGLQGKFNAGKDKAPDILEQAKQSLQELGEKTREKFTEVKDSPKTHEMMRSVQDKTAQAKDKVIEAKDVTTDKVQESRGAMEDKRRQSVVGKYVTVNILSKQDELLAKRGDMITHALVEQAEANDALDQLLGNAANEPLTQPQPQTEPETPDNGMSMTEVKVKRSTAAYMPMMGAKGGSTQPAERNHSSPKSKSSTHKSHHEK